MILHKWSTLITTAEVVLTQIGETHVVAGHGVILALDLEQQQHSDGVGQCGAVRMGQNYSPESVLKTYSGYEGFFRL